MEMTVEISMYPFRENYTEAVNEFIEKLRQYPDLHVTTCATSTMIVGEYRHLMQTLTDIMAWSFETQGRSVFVTKLIPGYSAD